MLSYYLSFAKADLVDATRAMHRMNKPGWMGLGSGAEVDLAGAERELKEMLGMVKKMQAQDRKAKAA